MKSIITSLKGITFILLFFTIQSSYANLWDNINVARKNINYQEIAFNSGVFTTVIKESEDHVNMIFYIPGDTLEAANIEFRFNESDSCSAINVYYTCEPCYYEHLKEIEESEYFHLHTPQINMVKNYEKEVAGIQRYCLEFTLL